MGAPTHVELQTGRGLDNLSHFEFLFNVSFMNSCILRDYVHACLMLRPEKPFDQILFQIARGTRPFPPVQMLTWKLADLWHCFVSRMPAHFQENTLGTATMTRKRLTQRYGGRCWTTPSPLERSKELMKHVTHVVQPTPSAQGGRARLSAYL